MVNNDNIYTLNLVNLKSQRLRCVMYFRSNYNELQHIKTHVWISNKCMVHSEDYLGKMYLISEKCGKIT